MPLPPACKVCGQRGVAVGGIGDDHEAMIGVGGVPTGARGWRGTRSCPMLNLDRLTARLVEEILRAIRSATLEELRDLTAPSKRTSSKSAAARRVPVPSRPVKRRLPGRVDTRLRSRIISEGADALPGRTIPEPTAEADITDPERLLARAPLSGARRASVPGESGAPAHREEEPPSSTVRPVVRLAVPLRPGERLASMPGASVVIRRSKRA
jgi:hypothetical protein